MREADRIECAAMGRTPKEALRLALRGSSFAYTAKVGGRPEAMLGLEVSNALSREATPWMLGTDEVYRQGRALLRLGPPLLRAMADSTRHLSNVVAVENARAIRFLRKLGFTIGSEVTVYRGVEFLTFTMELR